MKTSELIIVLLTLCSTLALAVEDKEPEPLKIESKFLHEELADFQHTEGITIYDRVYKMTFKGSEAQEGEAALFMYKSCDNLDAHRVFFDITRSYNGEVEAVCMTRAYLKD